MRLVMPSAAGIGLPASVMNDWKKPTREAEAKHDQAVQLLSKLRLIERVGAPADAARIAELRRRKIAGEQTEREAAELAKLLTHVKLRKDFATSILDCLRVGGVLAPAAPRWDEDERNGSAAPAAEPVTIAALDKYARERGLPRLYLAANSGARIGLSATVRERYRVAWVNATDPTQGFEYLYLTPADYAELAAKTAVNAERVVVDGEERFRITDVIGDEADLGVENLCGSGTIAGETARAYADIFTLTLVVGRAVGIGAYLVRLGDRTIQCASNAPIILTGHQALNKLLGRAIYTSNEQLGGANIMIPNGVSHIL